jgi:hypothetical protein
MGSISNLSVNATLTELTATLAVANADGSTVYRQTVDLPVLVPSATAQINATWPIEFEPPGPYTASLSVRDVETALIAYHSVALRVEDSGTTGAGLVGSLDAQPDPVAVGEPLFAATDVINGGNADMPDLQLRVDLALQPTVFRFELSCALPTSVSGDVQTMDGTALAGSDYEALAEAIVIPAGTRAVDVAVSVIGDLIDEPVESFYLDASTLNPEVVMLRDRAAAEVADDDGPVTISVADSNAIKGSARFGRIKRVRRALHRFAL